MNFENGSMLDIKRRINEGFYELIRAWESSWQTFEGSLYPHANIFDFLLQAETYGKVGRTIYLMSHIKLPQKMKVC